MKDGAEVRQVWTIDGEDGLDTTDAWNAGAAGNYWININSGDGLPDGEYELELYVDGEAGAVRPVSASAAAANRRPTRA